MIFAAGLGTRLQPLTNYKPKALLEYHEKAMIVHVIERLVYFGVTDIVVNVHHFSEQLIDFFKHNNFEANISISDESGLLLDTGGGLKKAKNYFNGSEDIILHNVDVISEIDLHKMMEFHKQSGGIATLAVSKRETNRYLLFNRRNELVGWLNEKDFDVKFPGPNKWHDEKLAFSGVHIINKSIFNFIKLEGKFSIIDLYLSLLANHKIMGFDHTGVAWEDIGKPQCFSI